MTALASPAGVLATVVSALNEADIPHMLVGSFASTLHGADRSTQDIDILIAPTPESLQAFTTRLEATDMYVSPSAQQALHRRDQFNVISPRTGWKVDLIMSKDRDFDRSRLARRKPTSIHGVGLWVASAEDTVLAKLEWAQMGESERQLIDVARVLEARRDALDHDYLRRWASTLEIQHMLDRAQELIDDDS
jgi:hypothetical protein